MFPSIKEALEELEIARKLNPGPWVDHSKNVGLAARNIAEKIPASSLPNQIPQEVRKQRNRTLISIWDEVLDSFTIEFEPKKLIFYFFVYFIIFI